jgi:hypothetical protein
MLAGGSILESLPSNFRFNHLRKCKVDAATMVYAAAGFELVSKYLKDKNPYAAQEIGGTQGQSVALLAFY